MNKGGGSAPASPDISAMTAAQTGANKEAVYESARVNQMNQVTPYGDVTYSGEIGSPERTATTTLNPQDQALLDRQRAIGGQLAQFGQSYVPRVEAALSEPFNLNGVPQISNMDDLMAGAQKTGDAYYQRAYQMIQPEMDRQAKQFETTLVNRGIMPGSQPYNEQMQAFRDQQGRVINDLSLGAQQQAGAEQSRLFNLEQAARQQGISDIQLQRSQPINEIAALLQGAPAISSPQVAQQAQYQMAPADVMGATQMNYAGAQNTFNQGQALERANLGGLYGLGAAGIGAFW